jgi:hypothetical protein
LLVVFTCIGGPNGGDEMDMTAVVERDGVVADVERDEFMALAREANAGNPSALARLRSVLAANPEIAARLGNLTGMVEHSLIGEIAQNDPTARAIISEKAFRLRQALLAGTDSPIIHLAVDRVLVSWIAIHVLDIKHSDPSRLAPAEGNMLLRVKVSAERRHEIALRNLAKIRALLEPPKKSKRRGAPAADTGEVLGVVG